VAALAAQAAGDVQATAGSWRLHAGLTCSQDDLSGVASPQAAEWAGRSAANVTAAAPAVPGCAGWTVPIHDPDLDADARVAGRSWTTWHMARGWQGWSRQTDLGAGLGPRVQDPQGSGGMRRFPYQARKCWPEQP
jgi:hypothetical protein